MMLSPEYKVHVEHCFDAYCRKAMRFEARNCYKSIKRKTDREVSLNLLMEEYNFEPPSMDDDSVFLPTQSPADFHINGQVVTVENEQLAAALLQLPEEMRELILLRYLLGVKEKEIASMYGRSRSTINYRKHRSLKVLRQEMERLNHEKT